MERKMNDTMVDALLLIGGGVLGAGLALMFAPYSGRKSRAKMARIGKSIGKKGERMYHDVTDNINDFASDVASTYGTVRKSVLRLVH